MNFGWIEIVLFYGFAIGFAVWQYWKTDRELKATRARRIEQESKTKTKTSTKAARDKSSPD